ncbi:MAG: DNA polymerase III subunit delta [Lachnospiraceae bacterium]|nr:DNA polymerase III subunit delta [Lachnospiraceae bacterium]
MAGFSKIIGHQKIIEHLKGAIEFEKVSHAYIFEGEDGIGKKMLAKAFAMTLQCMEGGNEPCMRCHSCKQAMTDNNPDIIMVGHDKPNIIGVDDIRTGLNSDVDIKPYSNRYKIYIIDDAEKMNVAAQNAMLKTIEEPPAYVIIMLLTTNSDIFLPTILSRCIKLSLKPLSFTMVFDYLVKNLGIKPDVAEFCASFSQGRLGKAIEIASSQEYVEIRETALWLLKNVDDMETDKLMDTFKRLATFKAQIHDFMDFMMMWYKDVLLYKATANVNALTFKDALSYIREQAVRHSYEGLENILNAFTKAKDRLKANVNFDLVVELLVMTIKEN